MTDTSSATREFEIREGSTLDTPYLTDVFYDQGEAFAFRDRERPDCKVYGRTVYPDGGATVWAEVIR